MFSIIATFTQVAGVILDKVILTRRQVSQHVFVPILFLFLFLLTTFLVPFFGNVSVTFFKPYYLVIFLLMLITAVIWNIYYYQGVQAEKVQHFELILMLQPLLTILLASLFLKGENNLPVLVASVVASIFLIFAHMNKNHLDFEVTTYKMLAAVVLMSIELIFIKILLEVLSPVTLYFVRTGIIFIFFLLLYKPQINRVANQNIYLIFLTAILGTAQMVTKFYAFEAYGVVYTSLILILSPILVYFFSTVFLHEKPKTKTVISAVVIIGCVIYATVLGK